MDNIILYLLTVIQEQYQTICWLLNLICRFIPLKQWAFDDSHSPKYQKISTDHLSVIKPSIQQNWQFLLEYYLWKSLCGAPHHYLYDVKSADRPSLPGTLSPLRFVLSAPTVDIPSSLN